MLLVLPLLICCSSKGLKSTNTTKNDKPFKVSFHELRYGICKTDSLYKQDLKTSPSGNQIISEAFKLIKKTDRIPGEVGQQFGVEYILESDFIGYLPVQQVWIFPEVITDGKGKAFKEARYTTEKPINSKTYSTYTLEKDFEVVKGEWIYQMWYDQEKLYERKFYIE